jgi:hypothetical protein
LQEQHTQTDTREKIHPQRIDQLFLQMGAIYPYKWNGQFPDVMAVRIAKSEWYDALRGFSDAEVQRGLSFCRKNGGAFPPSIPEFVKMCQPTLEELGVLSEERAFQDFLQKNFENPILKKTVQMLDYFGVSRMSTKDARREFLRIYKLCVEDYLVEVRQTAKNLGIGYATQKSLLWKQETEK